MTATRDARTAVRDASARGFIADLRRARLDADLTQAEVAERLGVSSARLSEFESGDVRVFPRLLDRWADALGMRIVAVPAEGPS